MRLFITTILLLSIFEFAFSQSNIQTEQSDPQAIQLLDKLSSKMDAFEAYRVDFDMTLDIPDQDQDVQTGFLLHAGDQFIFDIPSQKIIANKESVFVHLKKEKEIQINDPDFGDDGSLLSPAQMMRLYETEDFVFIVSDKNNSLTTIEFKPTDEYSEYAKVRIVIDHEKLDMQQMSIFSKDGSRIYLRIHQLIPNPPISANSFDFDPANHPDCYVEDLRID